MKMPPRRGSVTSPMGPIYSLGTERKMLLWGSLGARNVVKLTILIVLFCAVIWYASENKFSDLEDDIVELKRQLQNVQMKIEDLNVIDSKKSDIEKQLSDIASSLPELKEMAADLRDGINGLDQCPDSGSEFRAGDAENLRKVVKEELERFNADKTGRPDYALESSGGKILSTRNTVLHEHSVGAVLSLFGIPLCSAGSSARQLIQASVLPGECWAFKGHRGTAVVKLISKIFVSGFSLEHISQNISPTGDVTTAPKEFSLFGLQNMNEQEGFFFGQYRYNIYGRSVQYFPVLHNSTRQFDIIEFRVVSNHGHPEYTCVYRLRVHGELTKP